jgi:hypothetical protein
VTLDGRGIQTDPFSGRLEFFEEWREPYLSVEFNRFCHMAQFVCAVRRQS